MLETTTKNNDYDKVGLPKTAWASRIFICSPLSPPHLDVAVISLVPPTLNMKYVEFSVSGDNEPPSRNTSTVSMLFDK